MKTTKGFSVLVWLGLYSYILPPQLMTYLLPSCVTLRTHSMTRKSRQEINMLTDLNTNIKIQKVIQLLHSRFLSCFPFQGDPMKCASLINKTCNKNYFMYVFHVFWVQKNNSFDFKVLYQITCSFERKLMDRLSFVAGIWQALIILRGRRKARSRDKVLN